MAIGIGYIKDQDIQTRAEAFLAQYHPTEEIPIPLEEIVEFDMGLELLPLPDIERRFGFVAALSNNLQTILYDEHSDKKNPARFRFTLAHEIGHYILHGDLIRSLALTNKQDWKRTLEEIDPKVYSRIEFQAYIFAEYALVPTRLLAEALDAARQRAAMSGIDLQEAGEPAVGLVAGWIAKKFQVSTAVIEHRLKREQLSL